MGTTRADIRGWLETAKAQGSTHVIVVCDTFDHGDYPVYVSSDDNVRETAKQYDGKSMQRIMEVYSLAKPIEEQLRAHRAFNWD